MCEQIRLVAAFIAALGAINWGLVGLFNFNVIEQVAGLLGNKDLISKIIYVVIGIAGLYFAIDIFIPCTLFR